jgi:hypothetical protein
MHNGGLTVNFTAPVKLFLKAVKWVSQQRISFKACKSSFARPVKPTGGPTIVLEIHIFGGLVK